jgi:FkbM family methyltransferase
MKISQSLVLFRLLGFNARNIRRVIQNTDGARREALRACIFLLAGRFSPFVGVEHENVRYVLSPREPSGVCFPTFVRGYFDEETVRSMAAALAIHAGINTIKGLTILEVGANIGTETVSFLVRHSVARVLAVEPDSENLRFLRANLALNEVDDRVAIYAMALSDVDGKVMLEHSEDNWGDHRIRIPDSFGPGLHDERQRVTSDVQAWRLDSLVERGEIDLDDIDLVWIDAQGHEGHILAGAERLLAANIPIVTEYWPYGLRRAGGLDRFHALIAQRNGFVVDLRNPAIALAADRVAELADAYAADTQDDPTFLYTDLLLLPR